KKMTFNTRKTFKKFAKEVMMSFFETSKLEKKFYLTDSFFFFIKVLLEADEKDVRCKRLMDLSNFVLNFLNDTENKYTVNENETMKILKNFNPKLIAKNG